jgi:hypothetical protein
MVDDNHDYFVYKTVVFGSSTDPTLNEQLRNPNNLDQSLNDTSADKIRKYRADYNNNPPNTVSFMPDRETDHYRQDLYMIVGTMKD